MGSSRCGCGNLGAFGSGTLASINFVREIIGFSLASSVTLSPSELFIFSLSFIAFLAKIWPFLFGYPPIGIRIHIGIVVFRQLLLPLLLFFLLLFPFFVGRSRYCHSRFFF